MHPPPPIEKKDYLSRITSGLNFRALISLDVALSLNV